MWPIKSRCLDSLLPEGNIYVSSSSSYPIETSWITGPISTTDSCMIGVAPPPTAYLFLVASIQQLRDQLDNISCDLKRWHPHVWTVVVFCGYLVSHRSSDAAREVFRMLWEYSVYNSALMLNEDSVFRADPFLTGNKCGRDVVDIFHANCSPYLYPSLKKFPQCDFFVSARESFPFSYLNDDVYIGSDANLAQLIATSSNLRILWSTRTSPQSETSGPEAHAYYHNISRNEIDLAIGGPVISSDYFMNVSYGPSHTMQYLYFYVADCKDLMGWRRLVGMFSPTLWGVIFASVLVIMFVLFVFGKKDISQYFLVVFGILLEQPIRMPSEKSKFVLLSLIVSFYSLSSTYVIYLHSFTMNPPQYCKIDSVDDIIRKNITVMVSGTNDLIVNSVTTNKVRLALANKVASPELSKSAEMLDKMQNFALLERNLAMQFLIGRKGYGIHHIDYKVTSLSIGLVFPKGSLFGSRIQDVTLRCIESGLCDLWLKRLLGDHRSENPSLSIRPIVMSDIDSAFTILLTGFGFAFVAFLSEILIYNIKKYKSNSSNTLFRVKVHR